MTLCKEGDDVGTVLQLILQNDYHSKISRIVTLCVCELLGLTLSQTSLNNWTELNWTEIKEETYQIDGLEDITRVLLSPQKINL